MTRESGKPLSDRVAGASRGCGRGLAVTLGEAGATVYVTGRSRCRLVPSLSISLPTVLAWTRAARSRIVATTTTMPKTIAMPQLVLESPPMPQPSKPPVPFAVRYSHNGPEDRVVSTGGEGLG